MPVDISSVRKNPFQPLDDINMNTNTQGSYRNTPNPIRFSDLNVKPMTFHFVLAFLAFLTHRKILARVVVILFLRRQATLLRQTVPRLSPSTVVREQLLVPPCPLQAH